MDTGRVERAAREFELATRLDPLSVADFLLLGGTYEILGRKESAAHAFLRATELDPNNEQARKALQRIKNEQNEGGQGRALEFPKKEANLENQGTGRRR